MKLWNQKWTQEQYSNLQDEINTISYKKYINLYFSYSDANFTLHSTKKNIQSVGPGGAKSDEVSKISVMGMIGLVEYHFKNFAENSLCNIFIKRFFKSEFKFFLELYKFRLFAQHIQILRAYIQSNRRVSKKREKQLSHNEIFDIHNSRFIFHFIINFSNTFF